MTKKKELARIPSEKAYLQSATEITGISAHSLYRAASGATIDFHSAEFNRTDELNDCSGNYQFFEPLDGIVTSDMRHHMERLHEEDCGGAHEHAAPKARKEDGRKKIQEIEPASDLSPLTVVCEGRTLIVDTDVDRAMKCREVLNRRQLICTLLLTGKMAQDKPISLFSRLALVEVDDVAVTGAFGGFSATVTVSGKQRPLAESFDLILDLRPVSSFAGRRLPIGYYAPGPDPKDLDRVLGELPEMRGRFKKLHFTVFVKSRCLHGRSRTLDCLRCIDVCPFGAIRSENGKISVNHYLCQGCGGCVLVCPADAMEQVHPSREELPDILRRKLSGRDAGASFPTTVVISDGGATAAEDLSRKGRIANGLTLHFAVEEIGHIGVETILTAFSHGAGNVVVVCDSGNPQSVTDAVARQAEMACAILTGLDIDGDKCRFVVGAEKISFEEPPGNEVIDAEKHDAHAPGREHSSTGLERRALILLAAQRLAETSGNGKKWFPLPVGSYFGAVTIDAQACTLCMACVAACPSGALAAGGDVPRLLFVESRCHQCGLCRETCPEHAVQLLPRMMLDAKQLETPDVLCEAEVFRCIKCNEPFAPKKMVSRMTEKLKEHWMYANERQLRRLKMCRVCRTRDALASEDMRLWNR